MRAQSELATEKMAEQSELMEVTIGPGRSAES
jgi:hypothetical protein